MNTELKREREKKVVSQMIALYCKKNHKPKSGLCPVCAELDQYAKMRSDKCPFMERKTFCSNCKIHCYRPEMREDSGGDALCGASHDLLSSAHGDSACYSNKKRKKAIGKRR